MVVSDDLRFTLDKFTFSVPQDRQYTRNDCWLMRDDVAGVVRVGLTDFRQQASGDIAFVELPPAGLTVVQGEEMVAVETIKVTLAIPAPISGTIRNTNAMLTTQPELVNRDPYGDGWLVEMAIAVPGQMNALLEPGAYFRLMQEEAESERGKR